MSLTVLIVSEKNIIKRHRFNRYSEWTNLESMKNKTNLKDECHLCIFFNHESWWHKIRQFLAFRLHFFRVVEFRLFFAFSFRKDHSLSFRITKLTLNPH